MATGAFGGAALLGAVAIPAQLVPRLPGVGLLAVALATALEVLLAVLVTAVTVGALDAFGPVLGKIDTGLLAPRVPVNHLAAFALGATWAGMVGVIFAAKTTFVNPASFTFLESAIILCIVVLGGMGSIIGVILGAFILILMPEYLRAFSDYRMLVFGAVLVVMMVFRPQGLISNIRRTYTFSDKKGTAG